MSPRKNFADEIKKPAGQIDLELAALYFAAEMQPELDVDGALVALDKQVNDFLAEHPDYGDQAPFNSKYLVGLVSKILNYRGDSVEYYSPDNSLFNKVVENRLGIPISLATIYMAVGKRLGITVNGVGFPAHFLIRIVEPDKSETLVDPFTHVIIDKQSIDTLVETATQTFGGFDDRWLANAHPHDILLRVFENIKGAYLRFNEPENARIALEYQLLVRPDDANLIQQMQAFINAGDKGDDRTLN